MIETCHRPTCRSIAPCTLITVAAVGLPIAQHNTKSPIGSVARPRPLRSFLRYVFCGRFPAKARSLPLERLTTSSDCNFGRALTAPSGQGEAIAAFHIEVHLSEDKAVGCVSIASKTVATTASEGQQAGIATRASSAPVKGGGTRRLELFALRVRVMPPQNTQAAIDQSTFAFQTLSPGGHRHAKVGPPGSVEECIEVSIQQQRKAHRQLRERTTSRDERAERRALPRATGHLHRHARPLLGRDTVR